MTDTSQNNASQSKTSPEPEALDPRSDACEIFYKLPDGTDICLRPITKWDKDLLREGVSNLSDRSRYLRFFTGAKTVPEPILDRLVDVDPHNHIAWGAIDVSGSPARAIAAAHAIRIDGAQTMEVALAVLDEYQSRGIARLLLFEIAKACEQNGIVDLTAETLSENAGARRLFRALGGTANYSSGPVVRYAFRVGLFKRNAQRLVAEIFSS